MAVRLGVTQVDGTENHEVVYCSQDDKMSLSKIQKEIEKLISENPRVGLFAISQAILKAFSPQKKKKKSIKGKMRLPQTDFCAISKSGYGISSAFT